MTATDALRAALEARGKRVIVLGEDLPNPFNTLDLRGLTMDDTSQTLQGFAEWRSDCHWDSVPGRLLPKPTYRDYRLAVSSGRRRKHRR